MRRWLLLESKKDYEAALTRVDQLLDMNPDKKTSEGKELKLLLLLIEQYEDEHFPIDIPDPVDAIKVRMEDLGFTPADLVPAIGDKGTVSKVLARKVSLSLRMIRNLSTLLHLPAEILIKEAKRNAA
ncbi:MAG: transcriptional regulator [Cyclobacteriaceae bacterium]|nr:transcriptional regulator [Cyclobacteriaceae bacterium]